MAIETICEAAMAGMFGLFLGGVWLETRRAMRHLERNDEAFVLDECEREYHQALRRQTTQAAAQARLQLMRRRNEIETAPALGMESIGRILDRLATQANDAVREFDGATEFHFVPGGARTPSTANSLATRNTLNRAA